MKKVQVSVGYMEGRGCTHGVILQGVMDDKYIYARRVSEGETFGEPDYLRIRKDSTTVVEEESVFEAECRTIAVALENGLYDPRFQPFKKNSAVIAEIEKAVEEFNKAAAI